MQNVCHVVIFDLFYIGLLPDTLQRVRVEAKRTNGPNDLTVSNSPLNPPSQSPASMPGTSRLPKQSSCTSATNTDDSRKTSVYMEFRTAPIG